MESIISKFFINNWQRKIVAIITALIIWFFVNHSITDTKTIRNVPIRISNLPADKTIVGLQPNGILSKRINLTLTGTKDVIDELEPGDLEVNIDASAIDHADWIVQINKKNLVSLNPSIDLGNNITQVTHTEFVIKLNRLVTQKIPITILPPTGEPPPGYEFLDIWPLTLMQTVSGPEEEVARLKTKGLEVSFDLSEITKADLDALKSAQQNGANNEISFTVPNKWKQVIIPFRNQAVEEINDPDAQTLRIDFLRQELLPIDRPIPVQLFFPVKTLANLNPKKFTLTTGERLINKEDVILLTLPLHVRNVSHLFLDIIRDNLEINIVVAPKSEREVLPWSLQVINPHELEETYVAYQLSNLSTTKVTNPLVPKRREMLYRKRFREYLQRLSLYVSPDHKLNLESAIDGDKVKINNF